ncbi:diacylglycerol kinase catalytic domain-containing protein [Neolewinella antarctica]|uniref:Sugar kinase n=1 Tax=Neolewinella antarctica TaxID=442734 RepID=A0ABX0X775_9BACT|nr:sugar kinase [Neolewinella antarctica]NJC24905.1 hypothetical protein [Neolewinella antarctica]
MSDKQPTPLTIPDYAIIVRSKTRLEALIERFNTRAQAEFYINSLGGNFGEYEAEHTIFYRCLNEVQASLGKHLKNKILYREYLTNYVFSDRNLIVVVGQDGLVANTAKYSRGVPIIGVNPDPERYDGVLLPYSRHDFMDAVRRVLTGSFAHTDRRFAEARLSDGQSLLAFNDLFIGAASHVSARYELDYAGQREVQSSSGLIVSTQAGSTGWFSSVINMARGIAGNEAKLDPLQFRPSAEELVFAVREPFASVQTGIDIVTGRIDTQRPLQICSRMPQNGVIFSDGIEADFLSFTSGVVTQVGLSDAYCRLVD